MWVRPGWQSVTSWHLCLLKGRDAVCTTAVCTKDSNWTRSPCFLGRGTTHMELITIWHSIIPYCSDIQATSQDSSVHTDLTWRHQRLCILGLYRHYRNAVLLLLLFKGLTFTSQCLFLLQLNNSFMYACSRRPLSMDGNAIAMTRHRTVRCSDERPILCCYNSLSSASNIISIMETHSSSA